MSQIQRPNILWYWLRQVILEAKRVLACFDIFYPYFTPGLKRDLQIVTALKSRDSSSRLSEEVRYLGMSK